MFWKIALIVTLIYYAVLVILDIKSRKDYRLKAATTSAIGKTGIESETPEEPETILEEGIPNLLGNTNKHEEEISIPSVTGEVKKESPIPKPQDEAIKVLPEVQESQSGNISSKRGILTVAAPKTDDEAKRNFLFAGTSLDTAAPEELEESLAADKQLEANLEALVVDGSVIKTLEPERTELIPKPEAPDGKARIEEKQVPRPAGKISAGEEE